MNGRRTIFLALGAALAFPAAAHAKGASEATISGGGLDGAIVLKSDSGGDPTSGSPLARLADAAGFFPAVFGQSPDPMLESKPNGDLGQRLRIAWKLPGPAGIATIRQDLYPYAKPYPVTYTKPGQRFWDGERTRGGWFVSFPQLKSELVAAGLPAAPTSGSGGGSDWPALVGIGLGVAALAAVAVVLVRRRGYSDRLKAIRSVPGPS
jgi:hypothetical protein